mgnify:CR=1 FL=1|jgi:hypothetical protein
MDGHEDEKVAVRPIDTSAQFKKELKGCIKCSGIDPLEVKEIWALT